MDNPIENLVNELNRLPGIGDKTARRLAYYIINMDPSRVNGLVNAISNAKSNSKLCSICNNITDSDPCEICSSSLREKDIICVVENPKDVLSIEKAGRYNGVYHVLHGDIINSPDGDQKIKKLIERIRDENISEVILAFNPSISGEASITYISELLKPSGIKVSKIAYGLPFGSDMDFYDDQTINIAILNRTEV